MELLHTQYFLAKDIWSSFLCLVSATRYRDISSESAKMEGEAIAVAFNLKLYSTSHNHNKLMNAQEIGFILPIIICHSSFLSSCEFLLQFNLDFNAFSKWLCTQANNVVRQKYMCCVVNSGYHVKLKVLEAPAFQASKYLNCGNH